MVSLPTVDFGKQGAVRTRFAPSPNGQLHLGHAYSALCAHDFAKANGGTFVLRIEDIDGTRSRSEHVEGILADMAWLGLAWDGEVRYQSHHIARYQIALEWLKAMRAGLSLRLHPWRDRLGDQGHAGAAWARRAALSRHLQGSRD